MAESAEWRLWHHSNREGGPSPLRYRNHPMDGWLLEDWILEDSKKKCNFAGANNNKN
jgi:hypothetical protein